MEIIVTLVDFIIHIDKHLEIFVQQYGLWVYALLFAIVFVETGLVVMPFCPAIRCCSSSAPWAAPACSTCLWPAV